MSFWSKLFASTVLGASLVLAGTAEAQTVGSVAGQVTDEGGNPLAGVQVYVESVRDLY